MNIISKWLGVYDYTAVTNISCKKMALHAVHFRVACLAWLLPHKQMNFNITRWLAYDYANLDKI